MIRGIRKFLNPQYRNTTPEDEAAAVITVNSAIKKYAELRIKILQNWPRDAGKLREILKVNKKSMKKQRIEKI